MSQDRPGWKDWQGDGSKTHPPTRGCKAKTENLSNEPDSATLKPKREQSLNTAQKHRKLVEQDVSVIGNVY